MAITHAAIEVKEDETPHEVVEILMRQAVGLSLPFARLEVLGLLTLGTTAFLRFKTDCSVKAIESLENRLLVVREAGKFVVRGSTESTVDSLNMTQPSWQEGIHRVYRGPLINFWERQFIANVKRIT